MQSWKKAIMWIHKIVRRNGYKSSKKWKGGGDGSDVKQMFIEIDKIKSEWRLHSMGQLWPLCNALQLHNQEHNKPYIK
jgi:hypothetical protein